MVYCREKIRSCNKLLKQVKGVIAIMLGILTGILIVLVPKAYNDKSYPLYLGADRKIENETYFDKKYMVTFFGKNQREFKYLEKYFGEIKDWNFGFYQYSSSVYSDSKTSKVVNYYCRTDEELKYSDYGVSDYLIEKEKLSDHLCAFLDFSSAKLEIDNVIIHGNNDLLDSNRTMKRYLEVRFNEGEKISSYVYTPENLTKKEWEELINLGNGWYFVVYQYSPIKLREDS